MERVDKMYQILKDSGVEEASFEYIIGSCFPQAFENIKNRIHLAHTQGYLEGLQEQGIDYIYASDGAKELIKTGETQE